MKKTLYQYLGVEPTATEQEITQACQKCIAVCEMMKEQGKPQAASMLLILKDAQRVLLDREKRWEYDQKLKLDAKNTKYQSFDKKTIPDTKISQKPNNLLNVIDCIKLFGKHGNFLCQLNVLKTRNVITLCIGFAFLSLFFIFSPASILNLIKQGSYKTVTGSVFVKTNGGNNIKLALVDVFVMPIESNEKVQIKKIIETRKEFFDREMAAAQELDKYTAQVKNLTKEIREYTSMGILKYSSDNFPTYPASVKAMEKTIESEEYKKNYKDFTNLFLAAPLVKESIKAISDADGQFNFKLQKDIDYLLVAKDSRQVVGATEKYRWSIIIEKDANESSLMLSNHNMM